MSAGALLKRFSTSRSWSQGHSARRRLWKCELGNLWIWTQTC